MSYSPLWDSALQGVVDDTSPQLGGDLDVQSSAITTTVTDGNITFTMNGDGVIKVGSGYESQANIDDNTLVSRKWVTDEGYLSAEVNDLTSAVTWDDVPNANITEGSVTQHQAALSIAHTQITGAPWLEDINSESITELSDVTTASEETHQFFVWDGAKWENQWPGEAGIVIENGFENQTDSTLSWSDSTPDRTLTVSGTFTFWSGGKRFDKVAVNETKQVADITDNYFIYYDTSGVLQVTTDSPGDDPDLLDVYAYVAGVAWNTTQGQAVAVTDERHGRWMDSATHRYLHNVFGTAYVSGLGLGNLTIGGDGTDDSHARLSVADGVIYDEDIAFAIVNGSPQTLSGVAQIPMYYQTGAGGEWRVGTVSNFPFITTGTGGEDRPAWNNPDGGGAGVFGLTEMTDEYFGHIHLFSTTNILNPVIGIVGQAEYVDLTSAQDAAETAISNFAQGQLAGLFQESTPIGTLIFETDETGGMNNTALAAFRTTGGGDDYVDFRGAFGGGAGGGGFSTNDHGLLTGLGDDDHSQYHTDVRGDVRYYTKTLLDGGQLDTRYYTETELDAGQLDTRYYTESELNGTAGTAGAKINKVSGATAGNIATMTAAGEVQDSGSVVADFATASHNHAASDVTSGTFADARISEDSVTQHEAALEIAESQITSDGNTYVLTTREGAANGVATLGADSKVPSAQLPAIAITETYVVADQAARLGLAGSVQEGDIAVQTDNSTTYIMNGSGDGSAVGHWTVLATPTDAPVQSVDGLTGSVDLTSKYLQDIVQDTTPQLGGDLDVNTYAIVGVDAAPVATGTGGSVTLEAGIGGSTSGNAGNITLTPGTAAGSGSDGAVVITQTSAPASTTDKLYNLSGNLYWNAVDLTLAATGLQNVVEDVTPQLGGSLDTNGQTIVTLSNLDVVFVPNGTGVLSVTGTTNYESNVSDDDDIPNKKWVDDQAFLKNVVEDLSPQLGADLDTNGKKIVSTTFIELEAPATYGVVIESLGVTGSSPGGNVQLSTGNSVNGNAGDITVTAGRATGSGDDGSIRLKALDGVWIENDVSGAAASELRFREEFSSGLDYVALKAAGDLSDTSTTYTLPSAYPGSNGYVLASTTGGAMSWADPTGFGLQNIVEDTTPQLGGMLDVNGQSIGDGTLELIKFIETGSAVNEITITNAATTNGPKVSASGDDTNIDLNLAAKGTGSVVLETGTLNVNDNCIVGKPAATVTSDGGDVCIEGADGGATSGDAGSVTITGGDGDAGGDVALYGGESASGAGGAIFMQPGKGDGSAPTIPTPSGAVEPTEFWFVDAQSTPGYVGLKAPDDVSAGSTGDGNDTVWTLPEGDGTSGQVMATDGSGVLSWFSAAPAAGGGYLENVVEDTTPQLGGNLDVNGNSIVSVDDSGVAVLITAGSDTNNTGGASTITLQGGNVGTGGGTGLPGSVEIFAGDNLKTSGNVDGGSVDIQGGSATGGSLTDGGSVFVRGGVGSDEGGSIILQPGDDETDNSDDGYVLIQPRNDGFAPQLRIMGDTGTTFNYISFKAGDMSGGVTNYTLPTAFPGSSGYALVSTDAGVMSWADTTGFGLQNVVEDTTPQLGGDLDTQGNNIETAISSGLNISIRSGSTATGSSNSGSVNINSGGIADESSATTSGNIVLTTGVNNQSSGAIGTGEIQLTTSSATSSTGGIGGDIDLTTGSGGATGGSIVLTLGIDSGDQSDNGHVQIKGASAGHVPELRLFEDSTNGTNYVGLKAAASMDSSDPYTLPADYPTASGQVLASTTAGVMSWTDVDQTAASVVSISADPSPASISISKYVVDASGGPVTVTLHSAATARADDITIKKIDASANAVTIAVQSGDTMEGTLNGSVAITTQYASLTFANETGATSWWIF